MSDLSDCCQAPVKLVGGRGDFNDHEEGITMHYECSRCGEMCDLYVSDPDPLDKLYACRFCDGEQQTWNLKYETYEQCSCVDKLAAIRAYVLEEKLKARLVELDLLEQAITQGRDIGRFKLQRLEVLLERLSSGAK